MTILRSSRTYISICEHVFIHKKSKSMAKKNLNSFMQYTSYFICLDCAGHRTDFNMKRNLLFLKSFSVLYL